MLDVNGRESIGNVTKEIFEVLSPHFKCLLKSEKRNRFNAKRWENSRSDFS